MLALFGGKPVCSKEWPFYNTIGSEEKQLVQEVLDTGLLSDFYGSPGKKFRGGEKVLTLESDWCRAFDVPFSVSMNSLTSCLHAAFAALGVGAGDEVIIPQLGMSAGVAVVLALGARPVFADCDPHSMNLLPSEIERLASPKVKAALVVHLAGMPAELDPIVEACSRHGIALVEDNAQGPGALYKGRFAGTVGHIGCFSLNCHKIIQCGEGGIACTRDPELALNLQLFRNHGEKSVKALQGNGDVLWGLNLRMTEIQAAVGIAQLKKLDALNQRTIELCESVTSQMRLPGIIAPRVAEHSKHVYYILHLEYQQDQVGVSSERFAQALQAEGFPFYSHYGYLLSELPPFEKDPKIPPTEEFPGACQAIKNSLWTAFIRPNLEFEDMELLLEAFQKVYRHKDELIQKAQ